jgi:ubiquitin C-terminal hydrolase
MEELQEKGRIELEKIESELNKYIDENNKIKKENEMLLMKNKELEKEIKKIKLKYQSQEKVNNEEIMSIYKNPTLIGLNNTHNILNSILQCLSQTGELTICFLNNKNIEQIINDNNTSKDKYNQKLAPCYLKLIQNLWNINGTEAYSDDTFMNSIKNMNPLFEIENEKNIKEFIIFIIEQLHES